MTMQNDERIVDDQSTVEALVHAMSSNMIFFDDEEDIPMDDEEEEE